MHDEPLCSQQVNRLDEQNPLCSGLARLSDSAGQLVLGVCWSPGTSCPGAEVSGGLLPLSGAPRLGQRRGEVLRLSQLFTANGPFDPLVFPVWFHMLS